MQRCSWVLYVHNTDFIHSNHHHQVGVTSHEFKGQNQVWWSNVTWLLTHEIITEPREWAQKLPSWSTSRSMRPSYDQWGSSETEVIPSLSLLAWVVTFGDRQWSGSLWELHLGCRWVTDGIRSDWSMRCNYWEQCPYGTQPRLPEMRAQCEKAVPLLHLATTILIHK